MGCLLSSQSSDQQAAKPYFLDQKANQQGPTTLDLPIQNSLAEKLLTIRDISSLQSFIRDSSFDLLIRTSYTPSLDTISTISAILWEKYLDLVRRDPVCINSMSQRVLQDGQYSMRFSMQIKGQKPSEGYPLYIALHGGGGGPSSLNDSQWEHMKIYYLDSIDTGIYVATRGITNNWNLHFEDASYRLYDKLIKHFIAFHHVDPNRVYLLGFSAGGDGVYQIVPRMPDLWAAANMSAGHSNGIKFDNLHQTPFLIQMGEHDRAYNRNRVAAENFLELNRLHELRGSGYERELFIHCNGNHNSWSDRDASGRVYPVIVKSKAKEWLTNDSKEAVHCNTAAVHWLRQYKRNPYPNKLVWDPNTNAPRHIKNGTAYLREEDTKATLVMPRHLFYWLNLGHNPKLNENFVIEAELDVPSNTVHLRSLGSLDYISVLLNRNMLDLEKPIGVTVDGKNIGSIQVKPDLRVMARTLLERGDLYYIFSSELVLVKQGNGNWIISKHLEESLQM